MVSDSDERRASQIGEVVRTVARYTPWNSNCFPQAIVARVLLGLYGVDYCLFFGMRRSREQATHDAHAWIASGKVRVIGRYSFHQYAVVGVFTTPALAKTLGDQRSKPNSSPDLRTAQTVPRKP